MGSMSDGKTVTVEQMPEGLWRRAKARAAELGIPVYQLVRDALCAYLGGRS